MSQAGRCNICGNTACNKYRQMKDVVDGNATYKRWRGTPRLLIPGLVPGM